MRSLMGQVKIVQIVLIVLLAGACGSVLAQSRAVRGSSFANPHPAASANPHPADFGNPHPADFGNPHPAANPDVHRAFPSSTGQGITAKVDQTNFNSGNLSIAFPNAASVTIVLPANAQFAFTPLETQTIYPSNAGFTPSVPGPMILNQFGSNLPAAVITNNSVGGVLSPLPAQVITNATINTFALPNR